MDNGMLTLTMLHGGGHIASLTLNEKPRVNPMWIPVWKMIEPWEYNPGRDKSRYGLKLIASICGHNLCLGWFGDSSPEETKAGMDCHGEAPVRRWKMLGKKETCSSLSMTCRCELPVAQMNVTRTLTTKKMSDTIHVKEVVRNLSRRDIPFTICQHVTVAAPFLEKGVTVFDMSAVKGHTFPGRFGKTQRLKEDTAFTWPKGPGIKNRVVDMRMIGNEYKHSADFSAQLMNPSRKDAWFSAINPKLGVLLSYVWRRSDFPWLGNWEENCDRKTKPWGGKSLTRGMEFANTPFPVGLRRAVDMARFQGQPTYRWLPALCQETFEYDIILKDVPGSIKGVKDIKRTGNGFAFNWL